MASDDEKVIKISKLLSYSFDDRSLLNSLLVITDTPRGEDRGEAGPLDFASLLLTRELKSDGGYPMIAQSSTRGVALFHLTQAELEVIIHMHRREVIGATPSPFFPKHASSGFTRLVKKFLNPGQNSIY